MLRSHVRLDELPLSDDDLRIVALTESFAELKKRYDAAVDEDQRLSEVYYARRRPYPDVMRWCPADPVGYMIGEDVDGKRVPWCRPADIDRLKDKLPSRYDFVGTDEQFVSVKDSDFDQHGDPLPQYQHLWKRVTIERHVKRAEELTAALDLWRRDEKTLATELSIEASAERRSASYSDVSAAVEEVMSLQATSLAALRAKAFVIREWELNGSYDEDEASGMNPVYMISLLRDLLKEDDLDSATSVAA